MHNVSDSLKLRSRDDADCAKPAAFGRKDCLLEDNSMRAVARFKFPSFTAANTDAFYNK